MLLVAFMHLSNEISTTVITEDAIEGVPVFYYLRRNLTGGAGGREGSVTKGLAELMLYKG